MVAGAVAVATLVLGAAGRPLLAASRPPRVLERRAGQRGVLRGRRRGPKAPTDIEVAAFCELVARETRAGASLAAALESAAADAPMMCDTVGPVLAALGRGQSLAAAARRGAVDPSTPPGLALAVVAWCSELGGPAASPLERTAMTLRQRAALREEQAAHSAQARLSAKVLTFVPVGLLLLLAATDDEVRAALAAPGGVVVVAAGVGLNLVGWRWMQHVIGRAS